MATATFWPIVGRWSAGGVGTACRVIDSGGIGGIAGYLCKQIVNMCGKSTHAQLVER